MNNFNLHTPTRILFGKAEPMFCRPPTSAPAVPARKGNGSIAPLGASGNSIPRFGLCAGRDYSGDPVADYRPLRA